MKKVILFLAFICSLCASATPFRFADPAELKHSYLPKQKMEFINGVIKNKESTALPDIDALYSSKIKVDNLIFTLPGELCETMSACYKADLNADKTPDYIFVNVKVWNGRFTGLSDIAVFVSNSQKKYVLNTFEALRFDSAIINRQVMLVKYSLSDDDITFIRQIYTFNRNGQISLYNAGKFSAK